MTQKYNLYDRVRLIETNQIAYIVWIDDEPDHDSYLLEIIDEENGNRVAFYEKKDFALA